MCGNLLQWACTSYDVAFNGATFGNFPMTPWECVKVIDKVYVRDGSASAEEEEAFVQDMASMKAAHPHMVYQLFADDEPQYCDEGCPKCL